MDISTGEGPEENREGEGAETAMQVGDKASVRERVEGEECRLWGLGDGRDGKKPQVRRGRLCAGEEGESGGGRVEHRYRRRSENGQAVRAKERRQTNKRMRESKIRQEITGVRRGFAGKGELSCEVGRAAHLQDRAIRQSEGDDG